MTKSFLLLFIVIFNGCAGYRYQEKNNPFAQYAVKSISIPEFYNHSNFSNVSGPLTRELYLMLSGFKGLKVSPGDKNADAVLLGIITSDDKVLDSREGLDFRAVKNATNNAIGEDRGDFYVPARTKFQMRLRLIILKRPTSKEIELMKTSLGKFAVGPKVIVNETIDLSQTYNREIYPDEGIQVLGTQNRGAQKNSVELMAQEAANSFRDMILYAF